jgi:hypothetical protein
VQSRFSANRMHIWSPEYVNLLMTAPVKRTSSHALQPGNGTPVLHPECHTEHLKSGLRL